MKAHTRFEIVRGRNAYYVLKDGKEIHGPACHVRALEAMDRLKRDAKRQQRNCMNCASSFASEGPHNRLCSTCRSLSPYDGAA